MKLAIQKSEHMPDWYLIERAEHDGSMWIQPVSEGCARFMSSARFSDADVEGTGAEMLAIAKAIEARESEEFKRCAVEVLDDGVHFWSPRNSRENGVCSLAEADELAAAIRVAVAKGTECIEEAGADETSALGGEE